MAREWPLVAFTIIVQAAVGIYAFVGSLLFLRGPLAAGRAVGNLRLTLMLAVLGLLSAGLALSLFHLHHPVRAYRILANFGNSWLSREIFFMALFMGITALAGLLEWRGGGGETLMKMLFIFGALAGLLLILAMSKLYMLPSVPAWNRAHTPLSFFMTSVVLGVCALAFLPASPMGPRFDPTSFLACALAGITASFLNASLLDPRHGVFRARRRPSLQPPSVSSGLLHLVRLVLLALAAGVIVGVFSARRGGLAADTRALAPTVLLFVLAAAGEVSGRFLFYSGVGP